MNNKELIEAALEAREFSYSPYSGYSVGAALLCADGTVYTGCNIENAAFTPTNCAERTAIFKAVSDGKRDFLKIAVVGGKTGQPVSGACTPCGVCRQVLGEFCTPDFEIITVSNENEYEVTTLRRLLPNGFNKDEVLRNEY